MGFLLKLKKCFCSRKVPVKGLKKDPKASSTKLSGQMEDDDVAIARRKVLLDDALGEEGSVGSSTKKKGSSTNQRELEEESVARSDAYQSMLLMLRFLSMGGGQHVSKEENIQKSGEEIQEEETDDMRDAFNFFDADRNGSISVNDLHITLSNLGGNASIEECRLMVQAVSRTNNDNSSVAFADFQQLLVGI